MKYSIINLEKIYQTKDFRTDPEYWHPKYLSVFQKLNSKKNVFFEHYCTFIKKGCFDMPPSNYTVSRGIPFIRSGDMKNCFLDEESIVFITNQAHMKELKTELNKGDMVLSKIGTIGNMAINLRWDKINCSQNTIAIKIADKYKKESLFLMVFINSYFGKHQLVRYSQGQVQAKLTLEDLKKIIVPEFKIYFRGLISDLATESYHYLEQASLIYKAANDSLLSEMSLSHWQPKKAVSFVKNFSDTESAARFDAEYFQPKYDEIIELVKKYPNKYKTVKEIISFNDKNIVPKENIEHKYIELSNISNNGEITGFTHALGKDLPTRARRKIESGELILSSIEGSLNTIAIAGKAENGAFCSTGFYVLNSQAINVETLFVFFKSIAGQLQLKRGCAGTILTGISKDAMEKIFVPLINKPVQEQIKKSINEMYVKRKQSRALLEMAKRAVEIAIEEDEEVATKYIKQEISKLGIEVGVE